MIGLYLLAPLLGAMISLIGVRFGEVMSVLVFLFLLSLSLYFVPSVMGGEVFGLDFGPRGIFGIHLSLDMLSLIMLLVISLICLMASIFSVKYMEGYGGRVRYYVLLLLMALGMNLASLSSDLLNLYIGIEVASLSAYALIAFGLSEEELEASFKYQVMGAIGSLFILTGMGLIYLESGGLSFERMELGGSVIFALSLLIMGFSLKSALIPFHSWLPDASSSPAPVSSILSGVFIAVGAYAIARLSLSAFHPIPYSISMTLMTLGSVSLILGVILAIAQWDVRRLLAYDSISQMGYIILGIGSGNPIGMMGGIFHLFNHAVFKGLLFLSSGAIEYGGGSGGMREMGGVGLRMPVTGISSLFASLSISGIPPFNGFWSKLLIIIGLIKGGNIGFGIVAIMGSFLTLASFLKLQRYIFFGKPSERTLSLKEAPMLMLIPMVILALICLGVGIAYPWVIDIFDVAGAMR